MTRALQHYRRQLDTIDRDLLELMARRLDLACEVASRKLSSGSRLRDRKREASLLAALSEAARERGLPPDSVVRVFQEILNLSFYEQIATVSGTRKSARAVKVGYQGVPGAYSELAAERFMAARRKETNAIGYATVEAVADAVVAREIRYGALPVENSLAGSIHETYDQLRRFKLCIVGECELPIVHCLGVLKPVSPHEIKRVYSHPQALAQCSHYLARLPGAEVCPYFDTASAMQKIAAEEDLSAAAIGSEHAAERYGLTVLDRDIANHPENYTRFLLLSTRHEPVPRNASSKTSIVFALPHREGALLEALRVMHDYQINLSKLESRPRADEPWQYDFYVDFEGIRSDARTRKMLAVLGEITTELRVLGSYVSRSVPEGKPVTSDEIEDARRARKSKRR